MASRRYVLSFDMGEDKWVLKNQSTEKVIKRFEKKEQATRTGEDPRLAGPNLVLDAAHSELQQALEAHPDAVFLVSLLNRTNAQRMKLDQFGAKAG